MFGLMQTPAMLSFYIGLSNTACLILISFSKVDIQLTTPMKGRISTHNNLLTLERVYKALSHRLFIDGIVVFSNDFHNYEPHFTDGEIRVQR